MTGPVIGDRCTPISLNFNNSNLFSSVSQRISVTGEKLSMYTDPRWSYLSCLYLVKVLPVQGSLSLPIPTPYDDSVTDTSLSGTETG